MKRRKRFSKLSQKGHEKAVDVIFNDPRLIKIDPENVILKLKFPKLKNGKKETGDLIFVWKLDDKKYEIAIVEVKTGLYGGRDLLKLKWTKEFLKTHWKKVFETLSLKEQFEQEEDIIIYGRTISVSYIGKIIGVDLPYISEKKFLIKGSKFRNRKNSF